MDTTMSETLRLLKFDPAVALLIMANNQLNTNLMPQHATVGEPTSLGEKLTSVVITTRPTVDPVIYRRHSGSIVYQFERIPVSDIFGGMRLNATPPLTIQGVMQSIAFESGLSITDRDFENGVITGNSFELKAQPGSLRWVGQTTVMLNEPAELITLGEAFPNNILSGFIPPTFDAA